jgi:hypothetical protein
MRMTISFLLICRISIAQNLDWENTDKTYSRTWASGALIDREGNCVLAGANYRYGKMVEGFSGTFVRKYSSSGQLLWADTSGHTLGVEPGGVSIDRFGNIYSCVYVDPRGGGITFGGEFYPGLRSYLLKYDTNGKLLWAKPVNGTASEYLYIDQNDFLYINGWGYTQKVDLDGNSLFLIPSETGQISVDGNGNVCLRNKLCNKNGALIKNYPSRTRICDYQGNTYYYYSDTLAKLDKNDQLIWSRSTPKIFGTEIASVMTIDNDRLYLVKGVTDSMNTHFQILSYHTNGNYRWQFDYSKTFGTYLKDLAPKQIYARMGNILLTGSYGSNEGWTAVSLKLREADAELLGTESNQFPDILTVSPNPGRVFVIKGDLKMWRQFIISDTNGKCVYAENLSGCSDVSEYKVNLITLPAGAYVLSIYGENLTQHHKLLVE